MVFESWKLTQHFPRYVPDKFGPTGPFIYTFLKVVSMNFKKKFPVNPVETFLCNIDEDLIFLKLYFALFGVKKGLKCGSSACILHNSIDSPSKLDKVHENPFETFCKIDIKLTFEVSPKNMIPGRIFYTFLTIVPVIFKKKFRVNAVEIIAKCTKKLFCPNLAILGVKRTQKYAPRPCGTILYTFLKIVLGSLKNKFHVN